MNRFNLTFKGEILPGNDPKKIKLRFGELFGINDPVRLEQYFSGKTIVLHGNLDRKSAAEFYSKLKQLGVVTELVSVAPKTSSAASSKTTARSGSDKSTATDSAVQAEKRTTPSTRIVGQNWAVSSTRSSPNTPGGQVETSTTSTQATQAEERKAAKQAAIREAELVARRERQALEAAREQALREEAQRKAEEAAREQALREEAQRKAEEAAREQALREEAQRKAEEAAREQALREEAERKAEEAAREQALREEAERKAEEAAREQALREEAKRKAEEAAREQALREEAQRKAEAAAREQALREEAQRKAEAAAREQALREEAQRKAEEAARERTIRKEAKRKAKQEKQKKTREEEKRRAAEEAARQQALRQAFERKAAQRKARQEDQRREAAATATRVKAEQQRERDRADQQARLEAKVMAAATRKREEVDRAQRLAAAKATAEKARLKAQQAEQAARQKGMEDLAVQRAAQELSRQPSLKPGNARIKTKLEIPPGKSNPAINPKETGAKNRNRPGEPNLYGLRPFRNTPQIKARAEQSWARFRRDAVIVGLALACLFICGGYYLSLPPLQTLTGAGSLALTPESGPVLLAGDHLLLHDRAGIGTRSLGLQDMGLHDLRGPMVFSARGELLAPGHLDSAGAANAERGTRRLLRCNLEDQRCLTFSSDLAQADIASLVIHPLSGMLLLVDAQAGQLLKTSSDGTLIRSVDTVLPQHPVLHLEAGLLFMNSASGPAISVIRYDDKAFGEQLDEILLLPEPAIKAEQTRVWDFARAGNVWWVTLYNPDTNMAGVYRFDEQWNYMDQVGLAPGTRPEQLVGWGPRMLVRDSRHVPIQRFNALGEPETPLVSGLLQKLVTGQQGAVRVQGLAWQTGLVLLTLICVAGIVMAGVHSISSRVYRTQRERGAEPVDDLAGTIRWVEPVPDRAAQILRTAAACAALALLLLSLAIIQRVSLVQLTALLLALGGPVVALALFRNSPVGHIGILDGQLLLADHTGMYHLGGDARLQYRGPFLLVDDVVVFTGTRRLPAFSPREVTGEVAALARAGIKVDRKTVIIKLLQRQHPLARSAGVAMLGLVLAAVLLALPL